ncbi:MAG: hypothetical protein GF375_01940 [Candidatus Omnitrophica bacterium]|nr:hypothetical protein [Candidatus Omnitrophota bacterium]MBD3268887.1 hypothetical protein [Candidatus Omnitrophota bacterium]
MGHQYLFILIFILIFFPAATGYGWNESYTVNTSLEGTKTYNTKIGNYYQPNGDEDKGYNSAPLANQYDYIPVPEGENCCKGKGENYYSYHESDINLYKDLISNYLPENNMQNYYAYETEEGTYYYYSTDEEEEENGKSNKESSDKE